MQKTFRLFVSSTFSDFVEERRLLQTEVFPYIKEYCIYNGLVFQPIDLRWGVTDEASNDQKTLELCLEEVQSSKFYPYPNFLIMLGDRYGTIMLPYMIEQNDFEEISNTIKSEEDKKLLNNWYKLDKNQIPNSYILQPRVNEYKNRKNWKPINEQLKNILQNAVINLDIKEKSKYFISATEAEVVEGVFKFLDKTPFQKDLIEKYPKIEDKDYEHVYAYVRNITSIDNCKDKFIDKKEENKNDFNKNIDSFKQSMRTAIKTNNIFEIDVSLSVTKNEESNNLNYTYSQLENEFISKMREYLISSVDKFLEEQLEDLTFNKLEKEEQEKFRNLKLKDFLEDSRLKSLEKIDSYINSNEIQTLIVYGRSGLGKSSLMAKAIENSEIKFKNTNTKVIYKFVGSIATLINTPEILISILNELNINEEIRKVTNPQTMQEEPEKLEEFYYRIHDHLTSISQDTIIFLDAIDQVNNEDKFLWLPESLPSNLKFIISALEDENYEEDSKYFQILKEKSKNIYALEDFSEDDAIKLVNKNLNNFKRTIQENQLNYLIEIYKNIKTPLYLDVAVQEIMHWKSSDKIKQKDENGQSLATSQKMIIEEFILNLSKFYHHNKEFVKRVFSYLYLTQGLSESELIEVLNIDLQIDKEFENQVASDDNHVKEIKELPIVIWVRLYSHIKEFLKLENKDAQETMSFFHREFNEVIKSQVDIQQTHEHLILILQNLIIKHQDEEFDFNRWGKLYIELVKNYHIEYEFDWLLYDNSKLEYYGEFLGKITNEDFLKNIFHSIEEFGNISAKINNSKLENIYRKFFIYPVLSLINNSIKWVELYISGLSNLAYSLKKVGKIAVCLELEERSLEISKELYLNNPSRWGICYITTLINFANSLYDIKKIDGAKELSKASFEILRELYKINPSLYTIEYIRNLNILSICLIDTGEINEAIEFFQESLKILRELYKNNSDKWANVYTSNLNNLAEVLAYIGKIDESLELNQKSLEILKELYLLNPFLYVENYITTINNLACKFYTIGKINKSIELMKESQKIVTELYKGNPDRWAENYIKNLNNLASILYNIGEIDQSIELMKESQRIIIELYKENPSRWVEEYKIGLNNFGIVFYNIGRIADAIELFKDSLEITKRLYQQNTHNWLKSYTLTLNYLGKCFLSIKDFKNLILYFKEYFEIFNIDKVITNEKEFEYIIHPFIIYYQAAIYINENIDKLNVYIKEKIEYLKIKFDLNYFNQINIEFDKYKPLKESDSVFDNKSYEIFNKLFIKEDFS